MSALQIGDRVYPLGEVILYLDPGESGAGVEFSLYADCDGLKQAGFAINCITIPGERRISRTVVELRRGDADPLNELAESVICEPGAELGLESLRIAFGTVRDGRVPVALEAVCRSPGAAAIPVRGDLTARIVPSAGTPGDSPQLRLPL